MSALADLVRRGYACSRGGRAPCAYAARPRGRKKHGAACLSRRDSFELATLTRQTPGLIEGRTRSTFGALHVLLPFDPLNAELLPSLGVPKHSFQRGSLHGHLNTATNTTANRFGPQAPGAGVSRRRSAARAEALTPGKHPVVEARRSCGEPRAVRSAVSLSSSSTAWCFSTG